MLKFIFDSFFGKSQGSAPKNTNSADIVRAIKISDCYIKNSIREGGIVPGFGTLFRPRNERVGEI